MSSESETVLNGRNHQTERIFEATLTNNAQELKTVLRRFHRYELPPALPHTHTHIPCPSCPQSINNPSRHRRHHHYHGYNNSKTSNNNNHRHQCHRQKGEKRGRGGVKGQCRVEDQWLQSCPCHVVSQVTRSATARANAELAFQTMYCRHITDVGMHRIPENSTFPPPSAQCRCQVTVADHESTAVHLAAALGLQGPLKVLLKHHDVSDSLTVRDSTGHTPLSAAVLSQEVGVIRLVLRKTLSLCRQLPQQMLKTFVNQALGLAISLGDVHVVGEVLREGRARRLVKWEPNLLCWPVAHGNAPLLQLLLSHGATMQFGRSGVMMYRNPLHMAAFAYRNNTRKELELVKCLLQYGAEPSHQCFIRDTHNLVPVWGSALHMAVSSYQHPSTGHLVRPSPGIVQLLLEHKADPNSWNVRGESPLFWVKPDRSSLVLELLLQYGANPRLPNMEKDVYLTSSTFLSCAIDDNMILFVSVLLNHDPGLLHVRGRRGLTVLHHAILRPRLFTFLLMCGANPDAVDEAGESVVDRLLTCQSNIADMAARCECLLVCIRIGARFWRPTTRGKTLLRFFRPNLGPDCQDSALARGQIWQLVMLQMLFEVGYLGANDHLQYLLWTANSDWPENMKRVLEHRIHKPSSLLSSCRRVVLDAVDRATGGRRREVISQMTMVPGGIREYLQFSDLRNLRCQALDWCGEKRLDSIDTAADQTTDCCVSARWD